MLDIHKLMGSLSAYRPVFHSEADFQHALAWHIHETMPEREVRLEYPVSLDEQKAMHLDIWLQKEKLAIELKYCTRKLALEWNGESFDLTDQSAQDTRRYDFLKDMQRLEEVTSNTGFAVLLTNDPLFWRPPSPARKQTVDAAFRVHERQETTGSLAWSPLASEGTRKGREIPISLRGIYTMHWRDYWNFSDVKSGQFRYLAVSVDP